MATNDLWQITANGTYLGQNISNVFWYLETGNTTNNSAEKAAQAFVNVVLDPVRAIQHEFMQWQTVVATNWTTGLEQHTETVTGDNGLVPNASTEPMPSFVQFSFQFVRPAPIYSSGGKRFAGVPELYVTGNSENIPGVDLGAVEDALSAPLNNQTFFAQPVVLVRQKNKQPKNTAMGNPPFTTWQISQVLFNGVSSQRSRLSF